MDFGMLGMLFGSSSSGTPATAPAWNVASITEQLNSQQYQEVMTQLKVALDDYRDNRTVNWCVDQGYRKGHVCVLYLLTRNFLKFTSGRVATTNEQGFALLCAVLLLLRVAQDVHSCEIDMAKHGLEFVFKALRDKLGSWVYAQNPWSMPTVQKVVDELDKWVLGVQDGLPLPVWATAFGVSTFGWTFTWGNPVEADTAAFQRCQGIRATRTSVAHAFVQHMRTLTTWDAVFKADLADLTTVVPIQTPPPHHAADAGAGSGAGTGAGTGV